ncbi:unnamed protein product [Merluccius merluccius]
MHLFNVVGLIPRMRGEGVVSDALEDMEWEPLYSISILTDPVEAMEMEAPPPMDNLYAEEHNLSCLLSVIA